MPTTKTFSYNSIDANGRRTKGTVEAANEAAATHMLRQRGETRRRSGKPDEIAYQESRDERRRTAHPVSERTRDHSRHARSGCGDGQNIHGAKDSKSVQRHTFPLGHTIARQV